MSAKLLFIGLDSAEKGLVDAWSDTGRLPVLERLREGGLAGASECPPGFGAGAPLWRVFNSGVVTGAHARFHERVDQPGFVEPEPFWSVIGRTQKVAVIDIPNAPPVGVSNGIQIADWAVHGARYRPCRSWPASLAAEVESRFGSDPVGDCDATDGSEAGYRNLCERLVERVERKTRLAAHFLGRERWDLFMVGFSDAHCVGHQCWHLHDRAHRQHDPAMAERLGDPLERIYRTLDSAVGRLLEQAGADSTVLIYSGLGMGPRHDGNHLLDEILLRLQSDGPMQALRWRLHGLARRACERLPIRGLARGARQYLNASAQGRPPGYRIPFHDSHGGIRIQPMSPQAYDHYCDELARHLLELTDPSSGQPLVARVLRSRTLFPDDHTGTLPDLMIEWRGEAPVQAARSPRIGVVRGRTSRGRTGDHRPHGMLLARGPGIVPGTLAEPVAAFDLAPTIGRLTGVDLRALPGHPLPLFDSMGRHPSSPM